MLKLSPFFKKSGYENNLSAVDQLRVGLEMDILKNKNERMDVQEADQNVEV